MKLREVETTHREPALAATPGLPVADRRTSPRERRSAWVALAFLSPNLIGFLAFTFVPVIFSLVLAFTNVSIKPAVKPQFVGFQNFVDILGARPIGAGSPAVLVGFVGSAVLAIIGVVGILWAQLAGWRGVRLSGLILAAAGLCAIAAAGAGAGADAAIVGAIAVVCGGVIAARDGDVGFGVGTAPTILCLVGVAGICLLHGRMGEFYEARDHYFWKYFYNTLYLMIGIPLSIAGSLGLALLLHEELPTGGRVGQFVGAAICVLAGAATMTVVWQEVSPDLAVVVGVLWGFAAMGFAFNVVAYRTLFYLPTFTAGVAVMILWKALYNPETGPINAGLEALFRFFHVDAKGPEWLGSVDWAKPALIVMGIWISIGGTNMLLYLAGLSNLPKELLDAGEVDGAGSWQRFRNVTWPQLAPTTFFITLMAIIGGLQGGFEQARVMTTGGPAGATTTLAYYIYNKAFQDLDMGYAAAISWVLFAIVFVATALNVKFGRGMEADE